MILMNVPKLGPGLVCVNKKLLIVSIHRLLHSNKIIRVRFAPSPTGFLHLGGLRTALYNFLFARSKRGIFILRIEDTDRSRLVDGAVEQLHKDLEWAGITPDEGPFTGGSFGPYLQSERLNLYKCAAETLIENGAAYRCFCTQHRLELLRKDALRRRQIPRYDNRCRNLTNEEVQAKLKEGVEQCVRLKMIPGCESFHDLICGDITHDVAAIEGDPIILKSDGFPTYHLANVVDDHHMCVSHVLRGAEWQASTPKHLMLYKGFGWTPPQFAHLPLLLNSDGTKLSKRQGDVTVEHYRSSDILPRALVNFVTFSGGGFHRSDSDTVRNLDMDQLASQFDLSLVGAASCRVSLERLEDFNHVELVRQMSDDAEMKALETMFSAMVINTYKDRLDSQELDKKYIKSVLLWSQKRISRLSQLTGPEFTFLWVKPSPTDLNKIQADHVEAVYALLKVAQDFSQKSLSDLLKAFAKDRNLKVKDFMHLMRQLLSGLKEGPAVAEMLEILGQETSLARIQASLYFHKKDSQKPNNTDSVYNSYS